MNKNQRNSLILIIVIIVIFVLAYVGYGVLSKNGVDTSYKPTISSTIDDDDIQKASTESENSGSIEVDKQKENIDVDSKKELESENIDNKQQEDQEEVQQEDQEVTNVMPDIPLTLLNGEETTFWELAELGKPVVINSFASWCPPCKQEMPHFIELSEKYKDDVVFIFFDSFDGERETEEKLNAFADEYFNDDTICVIDPGYISYLFKSNSLPTTILLNKKGEAINGYQGMVSKEILEKAIIELISE